MKNVGKAVEKVDGETLAEIRKEPKVAGYVRFLRMLEKLKTPDIVRAIADSTDFPTIRPEESEVLATFDFSDTYEKARQKSKSNSTRYTA